MIRPLTAALFAISLALTAARSAKGDGHHFRNGPKGAAQNGACPLFPIAFQAAPQPKPGEFPPLGSAHRMDGELMAVDFIHRTGRFRATATGLVHNFTLPPYGIVRQMGTDADLRDVPLGMTCRVLLHKDADGEFTRLACLQDQFSADAAEGVTYRLDEAQLRDGKLLTTPPRRQGSWQTGTDRQRGNACLEER